MRAKQTEPAFVENEQAQPRARAPRAYRLPRGEDGAIAWGQLSDERASEVCQALIADPQFKAVLAQQEDTPKPEATIADATVTTLWNLALGVESVGVSLYQLRDSKLRRFAVPIIVNNTKLYTVTPQEIAPALDASKQALVELLTPEQLAWLEANQKWSIIAETFLKISVVKYTACQQALEAAIRKGSTAQPAGQPVNGKDKNAEQINVNARPGDGGEPITAN